MSIFWPRNDDLSQAFRDRNQVLPYGSPPVRFVRALMLGEEIPRRCE